MELFIICVETTVKAQTDTRYIEKTIKHIYSFPANAKLEWKYLKGKHNYKNRRLLAEIKRDCSLKTVSAAHVLYCIDVDDIYANSETEMRNKEIELFCKNEGFLFVWFCKNVEEVFLGKEVHKKDKVQEAKKFSNLKDLGIANELTLSSKTVRKKASNLLMVLDDFLRRKTDK